MSKVSRKDLERQLEDAKKLIKFQHQALKDAERVIEPFGVEVTTFVREKAREVRRARYYTNYFFDRNYPEEALNTDCYRATMIAIASQIIVDNCEMMIDQGVFRTGIRHTAKKMISELMRFVDNDLGGRSALEQYFQLIGWFESQFEVAFKVSLMDSERQNKFYNGWLELLNEANIEIQGI